ncbi:MAG TPA: hypothetical protein VFC63_09765 [Blastocatellia bacterium]|nr:hypothetical protein [Blastocatellia bacterium]
MPFDWSDYISLAEQLKNQSSEACQRSAISRLYYGIFCSARNFLETNELTYREGDIHSKVWNAFKNQGRQTHKAVAVAGMRLRDLRNAADYVDEINKLDEKLALAFLEANKLLLYLKQIQGHNT